jgi:hypothetical protein
MSQRRLDIHLLWKSGLLDILSEEGINNVNTAKEYSRVYDHYLALRDQGKNYTEAVELTAEKLCLTESKVKLAVAYCV